MKIGRKGLFVVLLVSVTSTYQIDGIPQRIAARTRALAAQIGSSLRSLAPRFYYGMLSRPQAQKLGRSLFGSMRNNFIRAQKLGIAQNLVETPEWIQARNFVTRISSGQQSQITNIEKAQRSLIFPSQRFFSTKSKESSSKDKQKETDWGERVENLGEELGIIFFSGLALLTYKLKRILKGKKIKLGIAVWKEVKHQMEVSQFNKAISEALEAIKDERLSIESRMTSLDLVISLLLTEVEEKKRLKLYKSNISIIRDLYLVHRIHIYPNLYFREKSFELLKLVASYIFSQEEIVIIAFEIAIIS